MTTSDQTPQEPEAPFAARPSALRLNIAVVAMLVITLFASCSAASSAQDAANNSANQTMVDTSGLATTQELQAMCQLLGAVAAKQGTDVTGVFKDNPTGTLCEQAALESSGHPR